MKKGERYECQCCGRVARITDLSNDGRFYAFEERYDDEPEDRWISNADAALKFRRIGDDAAAVVDKLRRSK